MTAVAARARGLETRLASDALLAEIEHASDVRALAAALGRAGLAEDAAWTAVEHAVRHRTAAQLAILARWTRDVPDALAAIELDEDRRSLRAIVRGLAAAVPAERRRLATTPTSRLPERVLARLAAATSVAELHAQLARIDHPLAPALGADDETAIDVLALEVALTTAYAAFARPRAKDRAVREYIAQVIDLENATSALLAAARGKGVAVPGLFVPGGTRLDASTFDRAARGSLDDARELLASAFTGTPLERALLAPSPSAIEDAALAWQLVTQRRLRRTDPHGLAAALHVVLRARDEAHRLRRAAWRLALGGSR